MALTNEYLAEVERFVRHGGTAWLKELARDPLKMMHDLSARDRYVSLYSWAIPNEDALTALSKAGPLIEIGAGTGYWAYLLRERGVDIKAYDLHPPNKRPNSYHADDKVWTNVLIGGPKKAAAYPDRTLFLCWPPMASPMAEQALEHFQGRRVAYIGEWNGCTASRGFHDRLTADWTLKDSIKLPNWPGTKDTLSVWERRRSKKNKKMSDH